MAIIEIKGKFLDVSGEPLRGTVRIEPVPLFIAENEEVIYSAPVTKALDDAGNLKVNVLATDRWKYRAKFNLHNKTGERAEMESVIFEAPESTTVGKMLASTYKTASTAPAITFLPAGPGEIKVSGASIDPKDSGSLLIPLEG